MQEAGSAADGKKERLAELAAAWQDTLLKLCYVYLRDREAARDAVQETFLKAYRAMDRFRGECSEKTWLIRIAVNVCRSMRRSPWRARTVSLADVPPASRRENPGSTSTRIIPSSTQRRKRRIRSVS